MSIKSIVFLKTENGGLVFCHGASIQPVHTYTGMPFVHRQFQWLVVHSGNHSGWLLLMFMIVKYIKHHHCFGSKQFCRETDTLVHTSSDQLVCIHHIEENLGSILSSAPNTSFLLMQILRSNGSWTK